MSVKWLSIKKGNELKKRTEESTESGILIRGMIVIAAMMKAKIIIEVGIGYDSMKILRIDSVI